MFLVSLGLILAYAAVAVWARTYEFADGAWFAFALEKNKPFDWVWRNFSGRLSSYVLYYWPAQAALNMGASNDISLRLWAGLYYVTPALCLAWCYAIVDRSQRWKIIWPCAYFNAFGVLTWGFPTETWLSGALAWPLLFLLTKKNPGKAALAAPILLLAFLFSHESWIALSPVLLLAFYHARQQSRTDALALFWLGSAMAAFALWVAIKWALPPDVQTAASLTNNAKNFFNPVLAIHNYAALKVLGVVLIGAVAFLGLRLLHAKPRTIVTLAFLAMAALALAPVHARGGSRYDVRGVVTLAQLAMLLCCVFATENPATEPSSSSARGAKAALIMGACLCIVAVHAVQSAIFVSELCDYRRLIVAEMRKDAPSPATPLDATSAVATSAVSWPWTLAFQSYLLAQRDDLDKIVYSVDGFRQFEPLRCAQAKAADAIEARPEKAMQGVERYACLTPAPAAPRPHVPKPKRHDPWLF